MIKRLVAALLFTCVLCGVMCACEPKPKEITADEAISIVLKDLGNDADNAGTPHVHNGKFNKQDCYNVYITVNGENLLYIVSTTGMILHKGHSDHSH